MPSPGGSRGWEKGGGEAGYLASGINCPEHIRQGPAWGGQGSFLEEVAAGGWLLKSKEECGNSWGRGNGLSVQPSW